MKKSLTIFGKKIRIERKKGLLKEESVFGQYDPETSTIYIDADLPPKTAHETLLHEAGHALFHRAGLSQSKVCRDVEEIIVDQFSIMFAENFPKSRY